MAPPRFLIRAVPIAVVLCLLALAGRAQAAAVATHFRIALSTPPTLGALSDVAAHDQYVILQPWQTRVARALKADNPRLEVLAYQNLGSISDAGTQDGLSSSGVPYAQASDRHPGWFLRTTAGARIREQGFPYLYMADVGDSGYQRRWSTNVLALLRSGPWDGVFVDDVNASPYPESGDVSIRGYPDAAAYRAAVRSMLAYVAPRLRASGKLEIANMGEWLDAPRAVDGWLRYVDGAMAEQFAKVSTTVGEGYRTPRQWRDQLREATTTQAMGRRFLAVTAAATGDTRAQVYGWASLLLVARGRASYLSTASYDGSAAAPSAYDAAIGAPRSGMLTLRHGVWERRFDHGLVIVNPTGSPERVRVAGVFGGSERRRVRSTLVAAQTGLVLTVRSFAPPAGSIPWWWWVVLLVALLIAGALTQRRRRGRGRARSRDPGARAPRAGG